MLAGGELVEFRARTGRGRAPGMAEVNPYQQPAGDERAARGKKKPFDPEAAGVPRETLRVTLGLVVLLGAMLGFVVGSAGLGLVDRIRPVSWFVFSGTVVRALIAVFVIAAAALGWISWTLQKKGYPRRRLSTFGAAGWALGLLCLWGIVRADTAAEQRRAEAACARISARPGVAATSPATPASQCEADFLRCRRWLRQQPGHAELTSDAEATRMSACMFDPPR